MAAQWRPSARTANVLLLGLALCTSACTASHVTSADGWTVLSQAPQTRKYRTWRAHFETLSLESTHQCRALHVDGEASPEAPVVVLVHGLGGAGPEWDDALTMLERTRPAAIYVYRWDPLVSRDEILRRLTSGLDELGRCLHRNITLLAHSAGGVLSSFAASMVDLPDDVQLEVVTVASPLAGTMARPEADSPFFLFDLGTRLKGSKEPSDHVRVVHLRTSYPADKWMRPGPDGVAPNAAEAGVPGATVVDLPEELSHVGALLWVTRRISKQGWDHWLDALLGG